MKASVQLKQENLQLLSGEIARPKYDRSRMKAGIVHIGVGGFHRSHDKIVSLTITEGGYNVNPATGEFDFSHPDAQHDLENPLRPSMVFGYLTAALKARRDNGLPAFTIQSCDNIQHNGEMTRKMVLGFARKQDAELARWIESEVCFPNAMVDRITPTFLIPTITENLDRGGRILCAVLVIAAWCLYSDKGIDRHARKLDIVDEKKEALREAAKLTGKDKLAFLKLMPVFGDLIQNERFTKLYSEMIDAVYENPDISLQMKRIVSESK
jgi:mannitol-1-phosphate/altronate dehydrogenase